MLKRRGNLEKNYYPKCDIILVQINWGGEGGFYYIPVEIQKEVFDRIGRGKYIKLPKPGTNPRGVEISKEALTMLVNHKLTRVIKINWIKTKVDYNPYKRWVDYWKED